MSYIFLLESGEESSAECYSDIPVSVLSRLSLSAEKSSCNASATESCRNSQSGTTCGLSTGGRGAEKSTVSAEASRAKTFPSLGRARGSTENEAGYGGSLRVLLARYDQNTRLWSVFLSCEPLLGAIDISAYAAKIDWVIVGGENAPLRKCREFDSRWASCLMYQAESFHIPYFFKSAGKNHYRWGSDDIALTTREYAAWYIKAKRR